MVLHLLGALMENFLEESVPLIKKVVGEFMERKHHAFHNVIYCCGKNL